MNTNRNRYSYAPTYVANKKTKTNKDSSTRKQRMLPRREIFKHNNKSIKNNIYNNEFFEPNSQPLINSVHTNTNHINNTPFASSHNSYNDVNLNVRKDFYNGFNNNISYHQGQNMPPDDNLNYYPNIPTSYDNPHLNNQRYHSEGHFFAQSSFTQTPQQNFNQINNTPPMPTKFSENYQDPNFYLQNIKQSHPRQEGSKSVDLLLQISLFLILPVLFVSGFFFKLSFANWAFLFISIISVITMIIRKNFVSNARITLGLIYTALTAVVLVSITTSSAIPPMSQDPRTPATNAVFGQVESPPSNETTEFAPSFNSNEQDEMFSLMNPLSEEGIDPFPEIDENPGLKASSSEALSQLRGFLDAWISNDNDKMLEFTVPSWRESSPNPKSALFSIKSARVAKSYEIVAVEGSDTDSYQNIGVEMVFEILSEEKTYKYTALMTKANGEWFVDPTSFKTSIVIENQETSDSQSNNESSPTQYEQASSDDSITNKTILYYNQDGGQYYHSSPECSSVKAKYLPLTGFYFEALNNSPYNNLKPCPVCKPPNR